MFARRKTAWHWILGIIWGVVLLLGIVVPLSLNQNRNGPPSNHSVLGDLKVYSQNGARVADWERKEAIKFSLDQVDSSIKYLFVAAAALLGFVIKILVDPLLNPQAGSKVISQGSKLMFVHSAIGSLLSISCGFLARLYFASLADSIGFSIYDEVGFAVLGQLMAFLLAALLLVTAAISLVYQRK